MEHQNAKATPNTNPSNEVPSLTRELVKNMIKGVSAAISPFVVVVESVGSNCRQLDEEENCSVFENM